MNAEFQKFFPTSEITPILRNLETNRYWINENLLIVTCGKERYNIAQAVMKDVRKDVRKKNWLPPETSRH